jgi:hypothetical protein
MAADDRSLIDLIKEAADIEGRVERSPYLMLAGALGIGFVLGGGFFTRLTERLASAALRVGVMGTLPRFVDEILAHLNRTAGEADGQPEEGKTS